MFLVCLVKLEPQEQRYALFVAFNFIFVFVSNFFFMIFLSSFSSIAIFRDHKVISVKRDPKEKKYDFYDMKH